MDGLNRLPRPALALGTLALFLTAMVDPVWFSSRMQGVALVPEPLWWLLGAIVSFYFGARHQAKGQAFQQEIAISLARTPEVVANLRALEGLRRQNAAQSDVPPTSLLTPVPPLSPSPVDVSGNAALQDWVKSGGGRDGQ